MLYSVYLLPDTFFNQDYKEYHELTGIDWLICQYTYWSSKMYKKFYSLIADS